MEGAALTEMEDIDTGAQSGVLNVDGAILEINPDVVVEM